MLIIFEMFERTFQYNESELQRFSLFLSLSLIRSSERNKKNHTDDNFCYSSSTTKNAVS